MIQKHAGYYKNKETGALHQFWVEPLGRGARMSVFDSPEEYTYDSEEDLVSEWEEMPAYSFSTLRLLHECPHNYLNKISGIKQPESIYLEEGKIAHGILQRHVSGVEKCESLKHLDIEFPIVEMKDFDPRCKFSVEYNGIVMYGFIDGLSDLIENNPKRMMEGKFSSSPWSLGKYKKDPQRKIYGWAIRSLEEAVLVTGQRQPDRWATDKVKTAKVKFTEKDYIDAENYINEALRKIKEGDFTSDLVNGKCTDPRCYWGENCMFK